MASMIFRRIQSATRNMRYVVEESRLGKGLGRKKQLSAEQMTTVTEGEPRNWPHGTDTKTPVLPGGR